MIDESSDWFLGVKYQQVDLLDEYLMCVIKASASGTLGMTHLLLKE